MTSSIHELSGFALSLPYSFYAYILFQVDSAFRR